MSPYHPTVQDVSVCLRCQWRMATRKPLLRNALGRTRNLILPRFVTSGQDRIESDGPVADNTAEAWENIQRMRHYTPEKSLSKKLDLHIKDPIGIDALGKPAEVLRLRNELQQALKRPEYMTFGKSNVTLGNPASSASSDELLDSMDLERGIVGADRVRENLESVKETWVSGLRDRFGPPTASEVEDLARRLRNGFTTDQLLKYSQKAGTSDPWEIDYDYSSDLYKRSAWTPGTTPFHGDASSRLRTRRHVKNDTVTTPPGKALASSSKGRPLKQTVAKKIIRQIWHIQNEQEKNSLGELDVWIQPEHLDLVLNHRRDVLERLSETYGVKVEASRSHGVLRITADHDSASDVLKLLQYILENIKRAELSLPGGGPKHTKQTAELSILLNQPLLEQIEQLTSTIIKTPSSTRMEGDPEKLVVYYLGPSDGDFEDVRRLILQALEPAATRETQVQWAGPFNAEGLSAEGVIRYPVDVGTGLPLNERSTEWSRWSSGTEKRSGHNLNAEYPLVASGSKSTQHSNNIMLSRATASASSFLYKEVQGEVLTAGQKPGSLASCWDTKLRHNTSAIFGQVLYPLDVPAKQDIQQQIRSRREFLTTVPRLRQFLMEMGSTNMKQHEELFIRLIPSHLSASETVSAKDLPDLDIRIAINTESQTISLRSVRLIVRERQSDVLLPDELMDLRLVVESYLPASKQVDQRILDFVEASNLDILGQDRLKTPASLTISIPPHAIRSRARTSNAALDPGSEVQVNYIFAGLSHRSFLQDEYLKYCLEYSTIEAGRTGGRRDELRLSLPETVHSDNTTEVFAPFFKVAHAIVQDFKHPGELLKEKHGLSVVTTRVGRIRPSVISRRRIVRRTRSTRPGARR